MLAGVPRVTGSSQAVFINTKFLQEFIFYLNPPSLNGDLFTDRIKILN